MAAALYFFSLLLYSVSFTVSVVLILAATGLIYINIPFLPDSAWDDACEFIKRPKEPSKNGNEETDVVPSAASIILQNIMDMSLRRADSKSTMSVWMRSMVTTM